MLNWFLSTPRQADKLFVFAVVDGKHVENGALKTMASRSN